MVHESRYTLLWNHGYFYCRINNIQKDAFVWSLHTMALPNAPGSVLNKFILNKPQWSAKYRGCTHHLNVSFSLLQAYLWCYSRANVPKDRWNSWSNLSLMVEYRNSKWSVLQFTDLVFRGCWLDFNVNSLAQRCPLPISVPFSILLPHRPALLRCKFRDFLPYLSANADSVDAESG